ncbi:MAG: hypothetical protein JWQ71_657, partial [Pedosphaera sp.]|nr:hypothetical protein [Pedosphaera sp.]
MRDLLIYSSDYLSVSHSKLNRASVRLETLVSPALHLS